MKNSDIILIAHRPLLQTKVMLTSIVTYLVAMSAGIFFTL